MNISENCLQLLRHATADERITAWHFAIIVAVVELAFIQGKWSGLRASRSKIMALSHIKTTPTYHKYFSELQELGYLKYTPSYHPECRSTVTILIALE